MHCVFYIKPDSFTEKWWGIIFGSSGEKLEDPTYAEKVSKLLSDGYHSSQTTGTTQESHICIPPHHLSFYSPSLPLSLFFLCVNSQFQPESQMGFGGTDGDNMSFSVCFTYTAGIDFGEINNQNCYLVKPGPIFIMFFFLWVQHSASQSGIYFWLSA